MAKILKTLQSDGFDDHIILRFLSTKFLPENRKPILNNTPKTTEEYNESLANSLTEYDPVETVRKQVFLTKRIPFIELMRSMESQKVKPNQHTFDLVCAHCFLIKDFVNARDNLQYTSAINRLLFRKDAFTSYVYDLDVKGATRSLKGLVQDRIKPEVNTLTRYLNVYFQNEVAIQKLKDPSIQEANREDSKKGLIEQTIIDFNMQDEMKVNLNRLLKRKLVLEDQVADFVHDLMATTGIKISPIASTVLQNKSNE